MPPEPRALLAERIKSVKEEGESKIAYLQSQMTEADEAAQIQLSERLKDIRADYLMRAKKLSQALKRRKNAQVA